MIVRRQADCGEELDFVSARQQALMESRGDGQSCKRGADVGSAVVDARAEQSRRERQRGQAVSFEVHLATCFHVVSRDAAVNAQAEWDAACGGPGARWGLALSTAKKQCVQQVAAVSAQQQQQPAFSAAAIYDMGVAGAQGGGKRTASLSGPRGRAGKGHAERRAAKRALQRQGAGGEQ